MGAASAGGARGPPPLGASGEPLLDHLTDHLALRLALNLREQRLHHRAHVLGTLRAHLLDRLVHRGPERLRRELLRKVALEDADLLLLLLRQLWASAGPVLLHRVPPALHLRAD